MGRYVDLHCTYDFNNWLEGFSRIPYSIYHFNMYESFVVDGPLITEQKILSIVEREKITLVIFPNLYYEINVSFLQKLRMASVKSLAVFFDDSARFEHTNRYYLGHCDFILTHESERALALYKPYGLTPQFFPCFPSLTFYDRLFCESTGAVSEIHDVSFIGANIADRSIYFSSLIEAGLPVSFYGSGWANGRVTQSVMLQLFRDSRISLNFTKSGVNDGSKQLKARAFEIMLAGGFLLTEYDPELISYFEVGAEIDTFSTPEECTEKVKFYLENPITREAMRQRGTEKCRRDFNFETAWSQYLERIETHKMKQDAIAVTGTFPARAIRSFVSWNSKYFLGRLSCKQIHLAADQLRWAIRDLAYLSRIHSGKVWLIVFSELIYCPVRRIKGICSKAFLLFTRWFFYQKLEILKNR